MKFFATRSQFASKLLALAGFDFEALFKTADETALKNAIDAKLTGLKPDAAALTAAKADGVKELFAAAKLTLPADTEPAAYLSALAGAQAENAQLEKTVEEITAGRAGLAAILTPLSAALETNGLKLEASHDEKGVFSAEKFTAALKTRISTRARELVAATGGPILDDAPAADPTKPKPAGKETKLTGLAATQAIFAARHAARAAQRN